MNTVPKTSPVLDYLGESGIRMKFTGAEMNSNRQRSPSESRTLREVGSSIRVYELQGQMVFSTTEVVVRDVAEGAEAIDYCIFDFRRVMSINESACRLFISIVSRMSKLGKTIPFTNLGGVPALRRAMKMALREQYETLFQAFEDTDLALEWCENQVLERYEPVRSFDTPVSAADYQLFQGLTPDEVRVIGKFLQRRVFPKGAVIVNIGDPANELFIVARGSVSVNITLASGSQRRLATLTPGMTFGELAVIDGARRSATVLADSEVECDTLKVDDFNRLVDSHPRIKITILENISLALCSRLRKANRELSVFDR